MASAVRVVALLVPGCGRLLANAGVTGKESDAEKGLDYFGARYMSSAQGRFTSPDLMVWALALNLMKVQPGHIPPPGAVAEVQQAVQGALQTGNYALKANGLFEGTTQINGVAVGFRGRFVDGVARDATVFTKQ